MAILSVHSVESHFMQKILIDNIFSEKYYDLLFSSNVIPRLLSTELDPDSPGSYEVIEGYQVSAGAIRDGQGWEEDG